MSEEDPIVEGFIVESREHLADVENQLLAIEAGGADIDVELVNTVFRAVHSIKGVAGFLGFTALAELAHNLKNVLNLVRNRELVLDETNTDVMLQAADALSAMIEDVQNSNDADISAHVAELQQVANGAKKTDDADADAEAVDALASSATSPDTVDQTEATSTELPVSGDAESESRTPEVVNGLSQNPKTPVPPASLETRASPEDGGGGCGTAAMATKPSLPPKKIRKSTGAGTPSTKSDTNIRVSVRLLDNLMNLAGELVLSRNQLVQTVASDASTGLESVAGRVDQVTSELQEAIMQTRMQVVGGAIC